METSGTAPVSPSSDVRERLRTAPPRRRQSLESRLGRPIDQSQTSSQTISRTSNPPTVLLWNRPDPSGWGQYKTDMSTNLNMNTLTCRVDARRMMGGDGPTVSGLCQIPGVDWLLAEQEQFSFATTPRFVDLDGLHQDNTRSLTDVRLRARQLTPLSQRGKLLTENKPNNKHHKMYRQFSKPPCHAPVEYSRDYSRATSVEGDDRRYAGLKAPVGDSLVAAYDIPWI